MLIVVNREAPCSLFGETALTQSLSFQLKTLRRARIIAQGGAICLVWFAWHLPDSGKLIALIQGNQSSLPLFLSLWRDGNNDARAAVVAGPTGCDPVRTSAQRRCGELLTVGQMAVLAGLPRQIARAICPACF